MQIFPASSVMDNPDFIAYATGNGDQGQGAPSLFAELFGQAQARAGSRSAPIQPSSESAAAKREDRTSASSKTSGNTSITDLKMTREDIASLEEGLKEYGLSDKDIEELREKVDSGLTWGGFLHTLSKKMDRTALDTNRQSFDVEATRELTSFFQKLGFTPQGADRLIKDLERGALVPVWQAVSAKLESMPADSLTEISKSELNALAKAMRLPGEAQEKLSGMFDALSRKELTQSDLKAATGFIKQQVAQAQAELKEKSEELKDLVAEAVRKAAGRQDLADAADNRETKETARLRALIEHEAKERGEKDATQARSKENASSVKSGASEADSRSKAAEDVRNHKAQGHGKDDGKAVEVPREGSAKTADRTGSEQGIKDAADRFGRATEDQDAAGQSKPDKGWAWGKNSGDAKDNQGSQQNAEAKDSSLSLLLSKLSHASGSATSQNDSSIEEMLASHRTPQATQAREVLSREQIMNQVQSGLLRNLGEGKHQLTLRLDPPNLGKMMVILQVQNKEVNAVIRTQNQDVSRVVAENMTQLRQALEQQGLKVDKLEVQTQLPNEQSPNQWQGASQHNMAWEKDVMERRRTAWRMLHGKGDDVVQEIQSPLKTAKISSNELDIFA